jgi:hypothetical protein
MPMLQGVIDFRVIFVIGNLMEIFKNWEIGFYGLKTHIF